MFQIWYFFVFCDDNLILTTILEENCTISRSQRTKLKFGACSARSQQTGQVQSEYKARWSGSHEVGFPRGAYEIMREGRRRGNSSLLKDRLLYKNRKLGPGRAGVPSSKYTN